MPPSYNFSLDQELGDPNADYKFTTFNGIEYLISFTEVTLITEVFDTFPVLMNGMYLVVAVTNVTTPSIPFDVKTGLTISHIYKDYLDKNDFNNIVIFNCDEIDGKQNKRHNAFSRWFLNYVDTTRIEKLDSVILTPYEENGIVLTYVNQYFSVLFSKSHPRYQAIFNEVEKFVNNNPLANPTLK